jgi:hypothetical protein
MKLLTLFEQPAKSSYDFYPFCGDTEELFKKNLRTMPDDWPWRSIPITYNVNSQGYRCPEWDKILWDESILMLGCSYVFGTGIDGKHTCAHQLSEILNHPVINLGIPGSSPVFHWFNTTKLLENNISPKAVIYFWPQNSRVLEFVNSGDPNLVRNCGAWLPGNFGKIWIMNKTQRIEYLRTCVISASSMWRCPVLNFTVDSENNNELPHLKMMQVIDHARDFTDTMTHPGIETNREWAKIIANDLQVLDNKWK